MDKTLTNKLMYIPNVPHKITPSVDCNQWLKRLNTQRNKPTNQISVENPKIVKPTNKKTLS